jgi:hypothetical protein
MQTPVKDDVVNRKDGKFNSRGEPKLSAQVKRMPTVTAQDAKNNGGEPNESKHDSIEYAREAAAICDEIRRDGRAGPKCEQTGRRQSAHGHWWESEPDVGRVANGVASRVDRLSALGNGQVPAVAALAFRILQ